MRHRLILLAAALVAGVVSIESQVRIVPFATQWLARPAGGGTAEALDLARYVADLQAVPVEGVTDNLSGLTYNAETGTLFAVVNRPATVVELTPEGAVLRRIRLRGLADPEAISHVAGDVFALVGERDSSVVWAEIPPGPETVDLAAAPRLGLDLGAWRNLGLEGASWDGTGGRLIVAQEALPIRILAIRNAGPGLAGPAVVEDWLPADHPALFMRDISSVSVHAPTGNLLVLSDRSRMLVAYAADGTPLGLLSLRRGSAGLAASIGQAEGVAVGSDGAIFLVSEPNLFYRFRPAD